MATKADRRVGSRRQRLGPKLPWHIKPTLDTQLTSSTSVLHLRKKKCLLCFVLFSHALVRQLNSQSEWSDGPTDRWAPTPIHHVESAVKKQTRTNFSQRCGTYWENLVGRWTKTARPSAWCVPGLRASFTSSLRQRRPSFAVKIVLSGFTKDAQWRISAEKAWTQLFLCLTLLNMHL